MTGASKFGNTRLGVGAAGGVILILLYCVLATGADAITKVIALSFDAPQLFCFSGGIVAALSLSAQRLSPNKTSLISKRPRTLALRSALFVLSSVFYFAAFRALPFAELFIFIALVPIFAALLSGPVLREHVSAKSWLALFGGALGMICLYPQGIDVLGYAHVCAFLGAFSGAGAMVLARLISRDDPNALLQVLYPNLALCLIMALALPYFYKPMQTVDFALIASYAGLLFLARWVLVLALARMQAYVATLLMNAQFVVMIFVGVFVFAELPSLNLIVGACVIMLSGAYLLFDTLPKASMSKRANGLITLKS